MGKWIPVLIFPVLRRWGAASAFLLVCWAFVGANLAFAQIDPDDEAISPTPSVFNGGSDPLPRQTWYATAEAIAMQRLNTGFDGVATLGKGSTGSFALSENSLYDSFEPGVQLLIGHNFGDSPYSLEGSYFWLTSADEKAQVTDTNSQLYSPFTGFGTTTNTALDPSNAVAIHEVSRLETGELNLRRQLQLPCGDPQITLMFGVRHLELTEEFDYTSVPAGNSNPVAVHAHTNNKLWGPQIGGTACYGDGCSWFQFDGKIGIFNNDANRDLTTVVNGGTIMHPRSYQSTTSMVGDFKASFLWKPTSALTATIGYRAFWIDEVALGSRNLNTDPATLTSPIGDPVINERGTLFYHGPFASLQVGW